MDMAFHRKHARSSISARAATEVNGRCQAVLRATEQADGASIVGDAEWLPHTFDGSGSSLVFARVPDSVRRSAPFLDGDAIKPLEKVALPLDSVQRNAASSPAAPIHFLFHTAFCGSTLLVRALEETGTVAGVREPAILLNVYHRFAKGREADETRRLDLALRLLRRPVDGRPAVLAKPSCFVNPLIPRLMNRAPEAKAILLHSDLRTFLLAIAKRGAEGRSWGRQVFANCRRTIPLQFGFSPEELLQQTDLQVAGLAWLMRRWLFDRVAAELGEARTLQLRSDRLFADPAAVVLETSRFLGLDVSADVAEQLANGSVFHWHSKEADRRFGADERSKELDKVRAAHGAEVEPTARWIEAVAAQRDIRLSS
jgi:hypothetical protein